MAAPIGNKNALGHRKTLEVRKKLSEIRKANPNRYWLGKKHSEATKEKISMKNKGKFAKENNPAWKGGLRSQDYIERRKFQRDMQKQVFERDNYTCQLCGIRNTDLQVDHIQSWAEYVELRFSLDNCRTLCAKCHYQITFGKPMPENIKSWGHNFSRRVAP